MQDEMTFEMEMNELERIQNEILFGDDHIDDDDDYERPEINNSIMEAAKWCVDKGFACFTSPSKNTFDIATKKKNRAMRTGWNKINMTDELTYVDPSDESLMINTGTQSNLTVLDFDNLNSYRKLAKLFPYIFRNAFTVKTFRGCHVYFRHDPTLKSGINVFVFPGIDIISDGKNITAPSSIRHIHNNGKEIGEFKYKYMHGQINIFPKQFYDYIKDDHMKKSQTSALVTDADIEKFAIESGAVRLHGSIKGNVGGSGGDAEIIDNSNVEGNGVDLDVAAKLCDIINISYLDDFAHWRKIVWAMKKIGLGEDFARKISSKSINFDEPGFGNMWDRVPENNQINYGTIHYYAKLSNEEAYRKIAIPTRKKLTTEFDEIAKEFEKKNFKILNGGYYIAIDNNEVPHVLSKLQMIERYDHMSYEAVIKLKKGDKVQKRQFIKDWMNCNDNIKMFKEANIYPPGMPTPEGHYNLWEPFAMEKVKDYKENLEGMEFMRNHLRILCATEENFNYFEAWIAQMITHPHRKSGVMPIFIGRQGSGKSSIARVLTAMIGENKSIDISNPDYVLGRFNGPLLGSFLIHFSELSKSAITSNDRLKDLITDDTVQVNEKGRRIVKINSYHRTLACTNGNDPIYTGKDDRRNYILRTSDELIGNKEHFNQLYEYLRNINVMKTLYEFYKNEDMANSFYKMKMPKNEHHEELKHLNRPMIIHWLEEFATEQVNIMNSDIDVQTSYSSSELYTKFCVWRDKNSIKYDLNALQFSCRFSNANIEGVDSSKRDKCGKIREFDFKKVLEHIKNNY